jgi:hypothetical protein
VWCVSGGVLLSHTVSRAVPSALKGLTSGFGMGPGVSPSLRPPERLCSTPTRGGVEVPERDRSIQLYRHLIIPPHPAPVSGVVCGSPAAPHFFGRGGGVAVGWEPHRDASNSSSFRLKVRGVFKPLGLLVPVNSTPYGASISGLSTQWSSWGPYTPRRGWEISSRGRLPA